MTSGVPVAPLLDDVAELARRVELLSLPHVVALNQWVDTHAAVRALPYFDPLDGGADGLDAYRRLAPEILRVLKPGGAFAVEIGYDQKDAVEALFRDAGALGVRTIKDLADRHRVVAGSKKPLETGA